MAVVELTRAPDGRVIADQRITLDGRQVPVAFELKVPRAWLQAGTDYYISISANTVNDPNDNWAWQLNDNVSGDMFYRTPTGSGAWSTLATTR